MSRLQPRPAEERVRDDPTSELWGEHRGRYRFACREAAGMRALDVACGAGFGLAMLRRAGASAVGLDLDPAALREARASDPRAPLARADAARLPFPDSCVDLLVSFETIEHLPDAGAAIGEFRRVLRPAGRLVLSTPNRAFGPPERRGANPFHVREFTGQELSDLLFDHFERATVYGQWVRPEYRFVPFLMLEPKADGLELTWKVLNRLPFAVKDRVARTLTGRSFYPGEGDYRFLPGEWHGAHALLAVASGARREP